MKSFILKSATVLSLSVCAGSAFASTLTATITDATPTLIDSSYDAFWVEETTTSTGGAYTLHNNTSNLTMVGFGVTNPDSNAVAGINGSSYGFITISNDYGGYYATPYTADFWQAFNLDAGNWTDTMLYGDYYADYTSAQTLFGDVGDALGTDGYANYYQISDATGILPGESAWGFMFSNAVAASSLFGVAVDSDNNTYAFITGTVTTDVPAVPLPAGMPLILTGIGAFGLIKRKRRG